MEENAEDESGLYLNKMASDGLPARAVGRWATTKLRVLENYMQLFTVGMKPTSKKRFNWSGLVYIDLFAGPGVCIVRGTEKEIEGSPLLALRTPHPFSKLYFVESDPESHAALASRTKETEKEGRSRAICDDCNRAVEQIVREPVPGALYLAFMDPTGLDIRFSTIETLAKELRCDLIINWFSSAIRRNLAQWQQSQESTKLDRFFGTGDWQKCLGSNKPFGRVFRDLVSLYRGQLTRIGYAHQADPYAIKNTKGAVLYWLWFASKSRRGLDFWKKAVRSSDEQRTFDFS
jgi:three-Cys-motif partner protein